MMHWTAQGIAAVWIALAADCGWVVIGVLQLVWSSFAVDPESSLWVTSWSFGTRRTKESMALSRISPSKMNVAAGCSRPPLVRHLGPVARLRRHPRVACRQLSFDLARPRAPTSPNARQAVQRRSGGSRMSPGPCGGGSGEGMSAPARWRKSKYHEERILGCPPMAMEYLARVFQYMKINQHDA
jgi:hypothetical protein